MRAEAGVRAEAWIRPRAWKNDTVWEGGAIFQQDGGVGGPRYFCSFEADAAGPMSRVAPFFGRQR